MFKFSCSYSNMIIYTKNDDSIFSNISIATPSKLYGNDSIYYSNIHIDNEPLYFKFMNCQTKHGILTSNNSIFTDLVLCHSNTNDFDYIHWFRELEDHLKCILYSKYNKWFMYDMTQDEIDYAFISSLRNYKENNSIIRINLKQTEHIPSCIVFDENEKIKSYDDVKKNFINGIIHIKGIQFTNNVFHLDIEMKQIMILETESIFRHCLIKLNKDMTEDIDTKKEENRLTVLKTNDTDTLDDVDIDHNQEFENKVENEVIQKIITNELNKEYDYSNSNSREDNNIENQEEKNRIGEKHLLLLCNNDTDMTTTYKEHDNIEEYNLDLKNIHGSVNINNPYKDFKEYYEEVKRKVELSKEQYLEEQQKMNEINQLYSMFHNQEE